MSVRTVCAASLCVFWLNSSAAGSPTICNAEFVEEFAALTMRVSTFPFPPVPPSVRLPSKNLTSLYEGTYLRSESDRVGLEVRYPTALTVLDKRLARALQRFWSKSSRSFEPCAGRIAARVAESSGLLRATRLAALERLVDESARDAALPEVVERALADLGSQLSERPNDDGAAVFRLLDRNCLTSPAIALHLVNHIKSGQVHSEALPSVVAVIAGRLGCGDDDEFVATFLGVCLDGELGGEAKRAAISARAPLSAGSDALLAGYAALVSSCDPDAAVAVLRVLAFATTRERVDASLLRNTALCGLGCASSIIREGACQLAGSVDGSETGHECATGRQHDDVVETPAGTDDGASLEARCRYWEARLRANGAECSRERDAGRVR